MSIAQSLGERRHEHWWTSVKERETLAADCNWNAEAQWDIFLHGLAIRIQNEIYTLDFPTALDELIDLAIQVDMRLQRRDQCAHNSRMSVVERECSSVAVDIVGPLFDPEPIQVGGARLSQEERE